MSGDQVSFQFEVDAAVPGDAPRKQTPCIRGIRTVPADHRGDGQPDVVPHRHVLVELVAGVVQDLVLGHELDELLVHLPVEPAEVLGPLRHLRNARRGVRRLSFPAPTARPPALRSAASAADGGGRCCEHGKLARDLNGEDGRRVGGGPRWGGPRTTRSSARFDGIVVCLYFINKNMFPFTSIKFNEKKK